MEAIKRWSVQILEGLKYLHTRNPPIIHRDLKCSNIFIDGKTSKIMIGDLGLSKRLWEGTQMSIAGTPEFMAPEIFANGVYDEKVDIYAFGMCVLELITKKDGYVSYAVNCFISHVMQWMEADPDASSLVSPVARRID